MKINGKIQIFDWEMAGEFPLGYDLITYVFRTSFLIYPRKKVNAVLTENIKYIREYYKEVEVEDFNKYIAEIAIIQLNYVKNKGVASLMKNWEELLNIVTVKSK